MPQYSKTTWVDGTAPAISAANLNKLEQGVFDSLRQDGSTTMSAQLVTIAGSAATPAVAPTGDSNTGIFFPAANSIGVVTDGSERVRFKSNGFVGVGDLDPSYRLDVVNYAATPLRVQRSGEYGEVIKIGRAGVGDTAGISYPADGTFQITTVATPRMTINASGNVGIGTISPADKLHVDGNIYLGTSNRTIYTAGAANLTFQSNTGTMLFARSNGADVAMFISAANNVGIGTASPTSKLHISSATGSYGNSIQITNTSTASSFQSVMAFYTDNSTSNQFLIGKNNVADGASTFLSNQANSSMIFETNGISRLLIENGGRTRPAANNTYELGSSSFRWSTIYAQNALNTSDARLKTDITESSLGLDFIASLNPVQFRYIEGGNTVERVQTGTVMVEITPAIPAQSEVPEIVDEEGNVIQEYVAAVDEIPAVTEERPTYEEVITPREGIRTHFGLLAQEVKAALPDGLDFAGWALADKEDAESTQFLGYAELIAPMIKAIQELNAKVEALEAQIVK
jgi:hypothetical protein